jgi:hypothetical protein
MSAMLRKRKQNQSIGICRDGPGFRVKPRARPWLRSRRARLGHLVVVDRRDGLSTSGGSGRTAGWCGVDSNNVAIDVESGSPRIALVNWRVDLNEIIVRAGADVTAAR